MSEGASSPWERIHKDAIVFDIHAHPALKLSLLRRSLTRLNRSAKYFDPFSVRSDFRKLEKGGVDVLQSVVVAPEKGLLEDCRPLKILKAILPTSRDLFSESYLTVTLSIMDAIENAVNCAVNQKTGKRYAQMARSVRELNNILNEKNDRRIAFVHSVEGAHSLDGDIDNLQILFDRGVASMTLAHFYVNKVAPPVFPFPAYAQKFGCFGGSRDLTLGLNQFGRDVVERMVELGMLVDVTHCTPRAREQVYEIVNGRAPILASHIGSYEINPNPYNLENWELEKIKESDGAVGVIFMNYWLTPEDRKDGIDYVVSTIKRFTERAGEDHVAIGSDFDGFTDPPDDLKDAGELPYLTQRLLEERFSEDQIKKILGGNALRILRTGWKR